MKMKNKTYDVWKWILLTFEPALITLISGLGLALHFDTELIVTIIGLGSAFLGSILHISSKNYNTEEVEELC